MEYEAELRMVRDGEAKDIAEASKPACKAPDIMHSFFIAPFMVGSNRCPRKRRRRRRRSLAGSWGKGKGLGKDGRVKKTATKNRSLKVCFAYNKNKGCPFAQICSRCGDQHPYHKCSEVKRPPGSAGNDE